MTTDPNLLEMARLEYELATIRATWPRTIASFNDDIAHLRARLDAAERERDDARAASSRDLEARRIACARVLERGSEDQQSISEWAISKFGSFSSDARCAARANEEMAELLGAIANDTRDAGSEIADVVILLYQLAWRLDICLHEEVDRKMKINRSRSWKTSGDGHGQHVGSKP